MPGVLTTLDALESEVFEPEVLEPELLLASVESLCAHARGTKNSASTAKTIPSCRFMIILLTLSDLNLLRNHERVMRLKHDVLSHLLTLDHVFVIELDLLLHTVGS